MPPGSGCAGASCAAAGAVIVAQRGSAAASELVTTDVAVGVGIERFEERFEIALRSVPVVLVPVVVLVPLVPVPVPPVVAVVPVPAF